MKCKPGRRAGSVLPLMLVLTLTAGATAACTTTGLARGRVESGRRTRRAAGSGYRDSIPRRLGLKAKRIRSSDRPSGFACDNLRRYEASTNSTRLHLPCRADPLPHQPALPYRPATGKPLRRYEYAHPGSLIHVDVTKFANIPRRRCTSSSPSSRAAPMASPPPAGPVNGAIPTEDRDRLRPHLIDVGAPPLGDTPASPTPRSAQTRRPTPPSPSCAGRPHGSPNAACSSTGYCPTTAAAITQTPGARCLLPLAGGARGCRPGGGSARPARRRG